MEERMERMPTKNWVYRLICFFLFRPKKKLCFRDFYVITQKVYEKRLGDGFSKKFALCKTLAIYKYQNGKIPDGIKITQNNGVVEIKYKND